MAKDPDFPTTVIVGETEYDTAEMNEKALLNARGIHFCDQQIQQLRNEWAIADTARLAYLHAIKSESVSRG
jgi:hypothetical protein